jgi:hypothetical protein
MCEQTSGGNYTQTYINASKAVLSPSDNKKFWVIKAIQGSHKEFTAGLGELRYYGPVRNEQGH